ncbi:MAG: type II toxin-antitoxin system VapC family toxin [Legionellales bacterium]|jgi:tRNA(fMet)-specific endonuclease VapC
MKYLLDTCTVSDFVKGDSPTMSKLKNCSPVDLGLSVISLMEIQYGLAHNKDRAKKIKPVLDAFLSTIKILDFKQGDAQHAALLRAFLHQEGKPIGSYDLLIAACALHHDLILVTSNSKEFTRAPGLQCENWRVY